jgi:hypothetical protein
MPARWLRLAVILRWFRSIPIGWLLYSRWCSFEAACVALHLDICREHHSVLEVRHFSLA